MKSRIPIIALATIFVLQLVDVSLRIAAGSTPWLGIGVLALAAVGIGWMAVRKPS